MSIQYTAEQLQRKFEGSPGSSGFPRIAEVLREEGRLEEAVNLCKDGLGRKPGAVTGHLVLGKCYVDLDRLDEAREQFETVLRLDPRCLSAMHHLARIMTKLQWPEAAAAYYRSILELEPWDTETLARLRDTVPTGAHGTAPMPTGGPDYVGAPAEAAVAPANLAFMPAAGREVEEFDLNEVADFLPAESNPSELAGALEDASLQDALMDRPSETARALPPFSAPADLTEPRPMDILTEASAPAVGAEEGAPAPISGDDVGDRLDSLFGSQDDSAPAAVVPAAPAFQDVNTTILVPAPADLLLDNGASATDTSVFAEGELVPPGERVSGDDIERRLDDLFSIPDETRMRPVMAEPAPEPMVFESTLFEPEAATAPEASAPEAAATPVNTAPAGDSPDIESALGKIFGDDSNENISNSMVITEALEPPFAVPAEDMVLATEPSATPGATGGDVVTGQDVADKLEALFGEEPAQPAQKSADGRNPADTTSEPLPAGSASWAAARPAEEEPLVLEEPLAEQAPPAEAAPAAGLSQDDTSLARTSGFFTKNEWEESLEASQPPSSDLMSTETMVPRGLGNDSAPPVTGDDIEERLDSLFDLGDESSLTGAAPREDAAAAELQDAFSAPEGTGFQRDAAEVTPEEPFPEVAGIAEAPALESPFPAPDADRTVTMPAMRETAADWLARQEEEAGKPKAPEALRQPPGGNETLFMSTEEVFLPEAPSGTPAAPGGRDTVSMEMVDGADVADRLDELFAPEEAAAAAAKAAAEAAIARGEATLDGEATLPLQEDLAVETGEMSLDEVALFAKDPEALLPAMEPDFAQPPTAETMVSGEDVQNRLSELFDEPPGVAEQAATEPEVPVEAFPESLGWQVGSAVAAAGEALPALEDEESPQAPSADAGAQVSEPESAATPPVPSPQGPASAKAAALSPLQDEEEGAPEEEENAPQSAAGANVATVTLAEIYFQQGLREQALQIYRQLLEREPGNDSVRKRIQEIEASKPETGPGPGADPRRPRPGLKVPKRKK